jgi:hypothetical protein
MSGLVVDEKLWWYLARASGIVAWLMLTATVLWGLLLSTRLLQDRRKPAWLLDLHRWLGGLALTFTAVHMAGLALDGYVDFGLRELLVPFASTWEPVAVAWGVVAFHLLVAVQVTSLMMRRLPRRAWKAIHSTSFALFWMTSLHAALAGSDTGSGWYRWSATAMILLVIFAVTYRVLAGTVRRSTPAASD